MTVRLIAGMVLFGIGMTGIFLANIFLTMMIGEVNRKRPEGNLISYFGFTGGKVARIFREYRREHPGGRLHIYALGGIVLAFAGLLGVAVCLGIIG
jgi:hypothetical protein